jgi:hypothetical protein
MSNPTLTKTFANASPSVAPYRLVRMAAATPDTTLLCTGATEAMIGINADIPVVAGQRIDVVLAGIYFIEAGGAFAPGARITSDATGRGVNAAPAAGANVSVIGYALDAAVTAGDIVRVMISQHSFQG